MGNINKCRIRPPEITLAAGKDWVYWAPPYLTLRSRRDIQEGRFGDTSTGRLAQCVRTYLAFPRMP